jgi:hypothetical protein
LRSAILGCFVLFAVAANAQSLSLPVPPIPPARPPTIDAPVPNLNTTVPYTELGQALVTLDTSINHRATPAPGYGYSPGASYQLDNDRRAFVLPGIMMHVPLP